MNSLLKKLPKQILFDLFILFILSLTPFLWLKNGEIIAGHDAGLPLSPTVHWQDRLNTWTLRYDAGKDQSFALAGFFIHGYEAILNNSGLSLTSQQLIQFSTYFFLIGLSMYILFSTMFPEEKNVTIIASTLYTFNHFLLQAWFIAERTKFSIYIAIPLIVTSLVFFTRKKISVLPAAIIISLILMVFNGGGFLPLYGATAVILLTYSSISLILSKNKISTFFQYCLLAITTGIISILLNSYWLLPYANYVTTNFATEVAEAGGLSGIINWIYSISENTSYLNLMRFQGIQEWYVNSEHPYAHYYFSSVLLKLISFLFITIPPFTLFFYKKRINRRFVIILLVVYLCSIFLMAGSHEPFGFIYIQMVKHIPGFIAFRTPYYKFAPGFFLAVSPLLALAIAVIQKKLKLRRSFEILSTFGVVALILLYHFPFFTTNFFQYTHDRTTKIKPPDYVFDYAQYSKSTSFPYQKILLLPGADPNTSVYQYKWQYWSLASLMSLLDNKAYITATTGKTYDAKLKQLLLQKITSDQPDWVIYAESLGIDAILFQKDISPYVFNGKEISIKQIESTLAKNQKIKLEKNFGEWDLYSLPKSNNFFFTDGYTQLIDYSESNVVPEFLLKQMQLPPASVISSASFLNESILRNNTIIVPQCQDCELARQQFEVSVEGSVIAPGSVLYPFYKTFNVLLGNSGNNLDPSRSSLKMNKTLFSMVQQKTYYLDRMTVWSQYLEVMEKYKKNIDTSLSEPLSNRAENDQLQFHLNNLLSQRDNLQSITTAINRQEEADIYYQVSVLINAAIKNIYESILTTQTLHKNSYPVEITNEDSFIASIYLPSMNSNSISDSTLTVDDKTTLLKIDSENPDWAVTTPMQLSTGLHEFIISDDIFSSIFKKGATDFHTLEYSQVSECGFLPIGALTPGSYLLTFLAQSEESQISPHFHITFESDTAPLLSYWGVEEKIFDSSTKRITIPFRIQITRDYKLAICDQKVKKITHVDLSNLTLDKIVEPVLILSTINSSSDKKVLEISDQEITPTKSLLSSATLPGSGLLFSRDNFSPFWIINNQYRPIPVNGNKIAWVIDNKISGDTIVLNYTQQDLYKKGWIISIISAILTILGALYATWKKFYKHHRVVS